MAQLVRDLMQKYEYNEFMTEYLLGLLPVNEAIELMEANEVRVTDSSMLRSSQVYV